MSKVRPTTSSVLFREQELPTSSSTAMCSACLPPTVSIRKQTYSHVKEVVFNTFDIYRFLDTRDKLAFLFGTETTTNDGVTVNVECIYYPRQQFNNATHEFEIFDDDFEDKLTVLTDTMGLKRIGVMFDSVDLTHEHLLLSAHYQDIYRSMDSGFGISRFITVRAISNFLMK
jgi:hypothetical protein